MGRYTAARDLDLKIKRRWYAVASRTHFGVYEEEPQGRFSQIARYQNAEARLQERQLVSDKPGRGVSSAAGGSIHHALEGIGISHHEQAAIQLCRQLARMLETARNSHRFTQLVLVAEPRLLGLLRLELTPGTRALVTDEMHYEPSDLPDRQLIAELHSRLTSGGLP